MDKLNIKKHVKEGYGKIAKLGGSCCSPSASCCGDDSQPKTISNKIGYTEQDLLSVPEGANLGLGCGNPVALASLRIGETVLDLGSGAGIDCFLAASKVGTSGKVIGVDMTPEMIEKANRNAVNQGYNNIEFRLGDIENLPVADNSVDVIISNCVINLSPEKEKVFNEAFRVLKQGGRLMVSDIVLIGELAEDIKGSIEAYVGCLSGAILKDDYLGLMKASGFEDVSIIDETLFPIRLIAGEPFAKKIIDELKIPQKKVEDIENSVSSIKVFARKP